MLPLARLHETSTGVFHKAPFVDSAKLNEGLVYEVPFRGFMKLS